MMIASEESIRHAIEEFLKEKVPDTEKNFFELGLVDSYRAVNLLFRLEEVFGVDLKVIEFGNNRNFRLSHFVKIIMERQVPAPGP